MQYSWRSLRRPGSRDTKDSLFFRVHICREGDCPWMNRRNDRAIIPWRGTQNFRNKEAAIAARRGAAVHNQRWNLHTKCIYVYGMYALVNMLFAKIPSLWSLRTRPSTIFRGRSRTYLRYYVENIQPAVFRRKTTKYPRFVDWSYCVDTLIVIRYETWNHPSKPW